MYLRSGTKAPTAIPFVATDVNVSNKLYQTAVVPTTEEDVVGPCTITPTEEIVVRLCAITPDLATFSLIRRKALALSGKP